MAGFLEYLLFCGYCVCLLFSIAYLGLFQFDSFTIFYV